MKPDKLPDSMLNQHTTPLDTTSKFAPAFPIRCFRCDKTLMGDLGIQVAHQLAGSAVKIHVTVHLECANAQ